MSSDLEMVLDITDSNAEDFIGRSLTSAILPTYNT